jgi:internalin A
VHFLRLIEPEETKPAPKDIKIQLLLQRQQSNKPENPTMPPPARDQVFISYSHKDNKWRDDLDTHLKPYLRDGSIKSWSDKQISPGSQWFTEIETALTNTQVAVLLVTPDFIASDFVHEHELGPFLKGAKEGGVRILWVAVRASSYKKTALKDYQAVLDPSQPLANMTGAERDHAWVKICEEIEEAVKARNPQ